MRYLISENRLQEIMNYFLDTFLESKTSSQFDNFIVISDIGDFDNENYTYPEHMEYDYEDGRLWISIIFLDYFKDTFGIKDSEAAQKYISDWFSNKFGVKINYVQ